MENVEKSGVSGKMVREDKATRNRREVVLHLLQVPISFTLPLKKACVKIMSVRHLCAHYNMILCQLYWGWQIIVQFYHSILTLMYKTLSLQKY